MYYNSTPGIVFEAWNLDSSENWVIGISSSSIKVTDKMLSAGWIIF